MVASFDSCHCSRCKNTVYLTGSFEYVLLSIGYLSCIRFPPHARLTALPPSFGNLIRLDRVSLDGNKLRRLPETLGRLKCHSFNVNNNFLVRLCTLLTDPGRHISSVVEYLFNSLFHTISTVFPRCTPMECFQLSMLCHMIRFLILARKPCVVDKYLW